MAFNDHAQRYIDAGYSPIPIKPGEKRPGYNVYGEPQKFTQWQRYCDRHMTPDELAWLAREGSKAGIGLALGFNNVVAIDIDVGPGEIFDGLSALLPESEWVKRGSKGFTAFFRTEQPMSAQKFKLRMKDGVLASEDDGGKPTAVLEILAHGNQTVIPPTIHPNTRKAYEWEGDPLSMCHAHQLPILPASFPDAVREYLRPLGYEPRAVNYVAGDWRTDHESIFRDVNDEALQKLDLWVPYLDRVDIDPNHRSGYRITAAWRSGDSYNIGIHGSGIQDFTGKDGNNGGMTAIDLVVLMNDLTPQEAFSWLFDKLNVEFNQMMDELSENMTREQEEAERRHREEFAERARQAALVEAEAQRKASEMAELDEEGMEHLSERARKIVEGRKMRVRDDQTLSDIIADSEGLFADLIKACTSSMETPSEAIAATSALAVMSALFGRHWAANRDGGGRTFANIYVFGTAPSGIGKTTALEMMQHLYDDAVDLAITPDIEAMARPEPQYDEHGEEIEQAAPMIAAIIKGAIYSKDVHAPATLQNRLITHPNTAMVVDEVSNFVRRIWSEKGGDAAVGLQGAIKKLISSANGTAYGTDYTVAAKNQTDVQNPGFSLIGFSTPKALMNALPMAAYEDGTIGRFLWLAEPGYPNMNLDIAPDRVAIQRCVDTMTSIIRTRVTRSSTDISMGGYLCPDLRIDPAIVPLTEQARQVYRQAKLYFHEEGRRANEADRDDAHLWARVAEVGMRVAIIHALGRDHIKPVISLNDMEIGLRLATYSITRWAAQADQAAGRAVVGAVETETLRKRAVGVIGNQGGRITKGDLNRRMKLDKRRTDDLCSDLVEAGMVTLVPGDRANVWYVELIDAD